MLVKIIGGPLNTIIFRNWQTISITECLIKINENSCIGIILLLTFIHKFQDKFILIVLYKSIVFPYF